MGIPVVTSPVGFLDGIIRDGETGLILGRSAANLLEALKILLNPEERSRIAVTARQHVERRHEWSNVFRAHCSAILAMDGDTRRD